MASHCQLTCRTVADKLLLVMAVHEAFCPHTKPEGVILQGAHSAGCGVEHAPSDAVKPESVFFDDSPPYQSPVPAAASLSFSHT